MEVYTMEDWKKDQTLNPQPGQQVAPNVYSDMYCVLPPLSLDAAAKTEWMRRLGIKFFQTFCAGEEYKQDDNGKGLYHTFGKTSDGRCFYLGLCKAEDEDY